MGSHIKRRRTDEVTQMLDAIRRIVSTLRIGSRAAEKAVGLSGAQLFVLQTLAEAPALSLNELAERTHTHQSSVSVVVRRLVERGLVERARDRADGRRLELTLAPAARRLLKRAPDTAQQRLVAAIRQMPAAERRRLASLLGRLVRGLGPGAGAPAMFFEETPAARPARSSRPTRARKANDAEA